MVVWNPAAERLLGYRRVDAVGQTLALTVPTAYRPAHVVGFHRAVATSRSGTAGSRSSSTPTRADGTTIEAEMTIGLITDDAGAVAGVIVSLRPAGPWRRIESYAPGDRNPTSR